MLCGKRVLISSVFYMPLDRTVLATRCLSVIIVSPITDVVIPLNLLLPLKKIHKKTRRWPKFKIILARELVLFFSQN